MARRVIHAAKAFVARAGKAHDEKPYQRMEDAARAK
jgi:hypothetical protein